MIGSTCVNNDSRIGNNSNGNTVIQNSQVNNPTFILGSSDDFVGVAAQMGRYDLIQQQFARMLENTKKTHPLYPEFSADYSAKLGKLISTPETADAFRNHPKKIKGTYRLDYSRYPHMEKSETPWAYAYRTQTVVEMDTTSYQEFLGDIEDPFPVLTYSKGMKTTISAPAFPNAVDAIMVSGNVSIPFQLRRLPCMEYGWLVFGNISEGHGFNIKIKANEAENKTTISFNKVQPATLETQLLREKLFQKMAETRMLRIEVAGKDIVSMNLSDQDVSMDMFLAAEPLVNHFERLLSIEQYTGCRFAPHLDNVSAEDYHTTRMLAASIKGEWYPTREKYDNAVCADYNRIASELLKDPNDGTFSSECSVMRISLYDQIFTADKAYAMYHDARISNLGAVRRSVRGRRKNIRLIIKPQTGKDYFVKYMRIDGLKLLQEQMR